MLKNLLTQLFKSFSGRSSRVAVTADGGQPAAELAADQLAEGDLAAAESNARKAVAAQPMNPHHRLLLAGVLEAAGRDADALAELLMAHECGPEDRGVLARVCSGLRRRGQAAQMLQLCERSIAETGESADVLHWLAVARYDLDDMEGAVEAGRRALAINPNNAALQVTLGSALLQLGSIDEALAAHRRALKLRPGYAEAEYEIGLIQLLQGRYRQGWEGFEYRQQLERNKAMRQPQPAWRGTSLKGRKIHLLREQGLGDEIMFASCLAPVIETAAECHLECDPRLATLFARSFPRLRVHAVDEGGEVQQRLMADDSFDQRSYIGSLPRYLRASVAQFPQHDGYLRADPERIAYWRERLAALGPGLRIGLSWRGGTAYTQQQRRSLELDDLLPLLSKAGVHWVNLQYGERRAALDELHRRHGIAVSDWPEAVDGDYDETAALVSSLDLVISVCTAVVHLSGALGRPAWVIAPQVPGWRYGLQGEAMPWYPSVRLFRQAQAGDWAPVVGAVGDALEARLRLGR